MILYFAAKILHIIGATVLIGTGAGIAFFMLMAHRSAETRVIAHTAGVVVLADTIFTATAVVLQPITGAILANEMGFPLSTSWIAASLALYVVIGLFWLPVVWMQIQMRNLARAAVAADAALPAAYYTLWKWWFAFGFPAFISIIGIVYLMTVKPDLW